MKQFDFSVPTEVIFGTGRIRELDSHLPDGVNTILIVTDKNVSKKSGALDKTLACLKDKAVHIFDDVEENPSLAQVAEGGRIARETGARLVIGIGGGSPMDAAKGCAVLAVNDGKMSDYMTGRPLETDPLPVICIPTSSGTGSEVTPYAVFTDPENEAKGGFGHPGLYPVVSIVDPELTYSMPPSVVVNTGLDVLTHAVEAYLCTLAYDLNDALALHAVETVLAHMPAAAQKDKEAMSRMAYAAMIAGIAIAGSGTILLHIMAYPLTVFHHIPHGKANAILLPAFLDFMRKHSTVKEKIARLDELFKTPGGVKAFVNGLGVSTRLGDHGITESQFEMFAQKTIVKGDVAITPATVTESEIIAIYRAAWDDRG